MTTISKIQAIEILDSRGNPTISVHIFLKNGTVGYASVPSGASTGAFEAFELRDGDPTRYNGKGVLQACANVNGPIAKLLIGKEVSNQKALDTLMIEADTTENKSHFGANAILSVSLAIARAAAIAKNLPLYAYLGGAAAVTLPCPMLNIINGGVHADNSLEFQEFMIRPHGFQSFSDSLRAGVEVFHTLKSILKKLGYSTSVGDEGGFAPDLQSHEEGLELIIQAIEKSGYIPGKEISLALDCAATSFYDTKTKLYIEKKNQIAGKIFKKWTSHQYVDYLTKLVRAFPIDSIEDGLAENDWDGWVYLTKKLNAIQIVGDDIFVTNPLFLKRGIQEKIANTILVKVNQIGTLTETLETIQMAHAHQYHTIISHRSGETEDSFIADLAVATNAGQIKTGAPSRSDRVAKYNRLLQIAYELGDRAHFNSSRF